MEIFALDFRIYDLPYIKPRPETVAQITLDPTIPTLTKSYFQPVVMERLNHGPLINDLIQVRLGIFRGQRRTPRSVVSSFLTRVSTNYTKPIKSAQSLQSSVGFITVSVEGYSTFRKLFSFRLVFSTHLIFTVYRVFDRIQHSISLPIQFPSIYHPDKSVSADTISRYVKWVLNVHTPPNLTDLT